MTIRNVEYFYHNYGSESSQVNSTVGICDVDSNEYVLSQACVMDPTTATTYAPPISCAAYINSSHTRLCADLICNKTGYTKFWIYVTLIKLG